MWWADASLEGQRRWALVPALLCDPAGHFSTLSLLFPIWGNKELKLPHQLSLLLFPPVTPPCFERFLYLLRNMLLIGIFALYVNWGPMTANQWLLVSQKKTW